MKIKADIPVEVARGAAMALDHIDCDCCASSEECAQWCMETDNTFCSELFTAAGMVPEPEDIPQKDNGKWEEKIDQYGHKYWLCPVCRFLFYDRLGTSPTEDSFNFCPECGTRLINEDEMTEEEEWQELRNLVNGGAKVWSDKE